MVKNRNAYTEVLEILNHVKIEDYNKIPKDVIDAMQVNSNIYYNFKYNKNIEFSEQKISEDAKYILAILFERYWATEVQKDKIKKYRKNKLQSLEKEKLTKYNYQDIFRNKGDKINNTPNNQNLIMIEYEENWIQKLIKKVRKIFLRK